MIRLLKNLLWARRAARRAHNDRDVKCRYWWGDRGGYLITGEHCYVCDPYR